MSKLGIFNQAAAPLNLDAIKPKTEAQTGGSLRRRIASLLR